MRAFSRQSQVSVAQLVNQTYTLKGNTNNAITIEAANVDRSGKMLLLIRKSAGSGDQLEWVEMNTFMIWLNLNQDELSVD